MAYRTRTQTSTKPLPQPERFKVGSTPILSSSSSSSGEDSPDLDFEGSWRLHEKSRKRKSRAKSDKRGKATRASESMAKGRGKQRASPAPRSSSPSITAARTREPKTESRPKRSRPGRRVKMPAKLGEAKTVASDGQEDRDSRDGRELAPSPDAPIYDAECAVNVDAPDHDDEEEATEGDIEPTSQKSQSPHQQGQKREAAKKRAAPKPKKTIARGRKQVRIDESQNTVRAIKSRFRARLRTEAKLTPIPASQPRRTAYPLTRTIKLLHTNTNPPPSSCSQPRRDSDFAVSSDSSDEGDNGNRDRISIENHAGDDDDDEEGESSTDQSDGRSSPGGPCVRGSGMAVDSDTLFPSSEARNNGLGPSAGPLAVFGPAQEKQEEQQEQQEDARSVEDEQSKDPGTASRVAPVARSGGRDLGVLRFLARWRVPSFDLMADMIRAAEDPSLASPEVMADALQTASPHRWDDLVDTCARIRELPPPTTVSRESGLQITLYRPPLVPLPVIPEVPERPSWNFEKSRRVLANGRQYLHDRVQALRRQRD